MTYQPHLFALDKLWGSARLGWTTILGQFQLGQTVDARLHIPVASFSVSDGYTIGEGGELSIDPATGTAQMSTHGPSTMNTLVAGNAFEASYNGVVMLAGSVAGVTASREADPEGGYTQQNTYTLTSRESILLATVEAWVSLPAETALDRISRWFAMDLTAVSAEHHTWVYTLVAAEDEPGSATRLDLARAFSAATKLPVRIRAYFTGDMSTLAVIDPDSPTGVITGADVWAHAIEYQTTPGSSALNPSSVSVESDNTTLLGGYTHLGGEVGFLAGDSVNLFGAVVPVARVTHRFGEHYSAGLELRPSGGTPPVSAAAPTITHPAGGASPGTVDVTDHGAVGDGRTDSGAAINAAIDASLPGASIVFPGGVYIIETPVLLRANRAYLAEGDVTLQQRADTEMLCLVMVNPTEPLPRRNIHWRGISLFGDAMNQFFDAGLPESPSNPLQTHNTCYRAGSGFEGNNGMMLAAVQFSAFYDLAIRNMGGTGLVIRGIDNTGEAGEDDFNETTSTLHFISPYVYACGKYGVYFGERSDDNHIDFGDIGACQYECVYMVAGSSSLRNTTIWGSKQANGILIGAPTNQIIGCQIEGHAQHGIKIVDYGTYNMIASNKIYYCSTQAGGGYDGINIESSVGATNPCKYNSVLGNFIYAGIGEFFASPADWLGMRHGIAMEGSTIHTVINGNSIDCVAAGAIPSNGFIGVYGLTAGDTFNGLKYTNATEDAARIAASPRGLLPGVPWWRDDVGLMFLYTGPSRDRTERMLLGKYDIDGGAIWIGPGTVDLSVTIPQVRFDANYAVILSPSWNTTWWVTDKFTDQFTMHFGTPNVAGAPCDWTLLRQGD